jgi:hypothetical protein
MAGSKTRGGIREIKYVGSPEWNAAFPNGASGVSTPLPDGVNLGNGYIPPIDNSTHNPAGGNPWKETGGTS